MSLPLSWPSWLARRSGYAENSSAHAGGRPVRDLADRPAPAGRWCLG